MIKFYHSNDLDVLKGILLSLMKHNPPSPFEQEAILVQSQGMAHWLKLNIADGLGVSAQVDFPLPFSFVWKVFNQLRPDLPERSHFDKPFMTWKLMTLLPELIEAARDNPDHPCAAIAHYLDDDPQGLRCFQLSQTIADVFDQYLVYRPDWLLAWENQQDEIEGADISLHPWQPVVWRALVERSRELGHSLDHRARLMEQLADLVRQHPERLKGLPKRLFVFGIAALPGSYWQVLNAISERIEVHFFLLNPCRNFWGDIVDDKRRARILRQSPESAAYLERGNPLLASWGQLGRDFLTMVHDTELELDVEAWVDPQPQPQRNLLQHLQADILELQDRQQLAFTEQALDSSDFKQAVEASDDSIRIVSAHSPLREVQRLQDQLLNWLADDPALQPRDIVVMVPDIDAYAPYIDAVFASADISRKANSLYIPWAIADQSLVAENPLLDTFLALLALPDSRMTVTEVQDWLEVPAIRLQFGIAESDLDTIKEWLQRANVRWGLDRQQRHGLGVPGFEQNSWRKGLRQLLLGLMIPETLPPSSMVPGWQGDWPVSAVEGSSAELLGKLLALIDALEYWQQALAKPATALQWVERVSELTRQLFTSDFSRADQVSAYEQQRQQNSLQQIRDAIQSWQQELELGGLVNDEQGGEQQLSIRVVRAWFVNELGQQGGWQRFLAGPVNFCTLMPMRSIPFRVVCMLGMNDADYPRKVTPVGFDLIMAGKRRQGDRSRRDDDRYLFLEAVSSAQDKLYISYRGRGVRENNEQQPSVLVSELTDYLCDGYCLSDWQQAAHADSRQWMRQWLQEELPLQPFNPQLYWPRSPDNAAQDNVSWDNTIQDSTKQNSKIPSRTIRSYHPLWAAVASAPMQVEPERFIAKPLPIPEEWQDDPQSALQLELSDIQSALKSSATFFLKRRLRIDLQPRWQEERTEEPFRLDTLEQYLFRDEEVGLEIAQVAAGPEPDSGLQPDTLKRLQRLQSLGQLPVNVLGELALEDAIAEVQPLVQRIRQLQPQVGEATSWRVELPLPASVRALFGNHERLSANEQLTISGESLAMTAGKTLVRWRSGGVRGSHLLDAWAELLLANLASDGEVSNLSYLGLGDRKSGEVCEYQLGCPEPEQSQALLLEMVEYLMQSWLMAGDLLPDLLFSLLSQTPDVDLAAVAAGSNGDDSEHQQAIEEWLTLVRQALASDFGELQGAELQRCRPELLESLLKPDYLQHWVSRHNHLMSSLMKYTTRADAAQEGA